jgi:hypothetical protein
MAFEVNFYVEACAEGVMLRFSDQEGSWVEIPLQWNQTVKMEKILAQLIGARTAEWALRGMPREKKVSGPISFRQSFRLTKKDRKFLKGLQISAE